MIHLDSSWSWVFLAALAEGVSTLFNKETVSLANSHLEGRTRNPGAKPVSLPEAFGW